MLLKIFILFFLPGRIFAQSDCALSMPKNHKATKVYFNIFKWITPEDSYNGNAQFIEHGNLVDLYCENGFVKDDLLGKSYTFECVNGRFNYTLTYADLLCKSDFHKYTKTFRVPNLKLESDLFQCNDRKWEVYKVFSEKNDGSLKHLYTVCFDKSIMRTKFVVQARKKDVSVKNQGQRNDVWGFDFFGYDAYQKAKLSEGYVSRIQKKRITSAFSEKYNKKRKYPYRFNRGHLAPYSDFDDIEDKRASCEYINVAPQWAEFNGNSWSLVERRVREIIEGNPSDWEIYTGTYGSIQTTRGPLFVSFFLDLQGNLKPFVPVPKLYWKIVYNTVYKNDSRVFVGINNPEFKSPEEIPQNYILCHPKLSDKGTFFSGSEFKGFIYECDLNEFLKNLNGVENTVKPKREDNVFVLF